MANLTMEQAHELLRLLAEDTSEWAGIPMPLENVRLVVHKSYPFAKVCRDQDVRDDVPMEEVPETANRWYNKRGFEVYIWRENGRVRHGIVPCKPIDMVLQTMGVSKVWKIEAEVKACERLSREVGDYKYRCYLMTGTFIETSKRSGVTYVFRRLRPTLALRAQGEMVRVLVGLCGHPIAHYQETWAGACCPTDDVLAALLTMRADEPLLWRQYNHIPPTRPECGAYV